MRPARETVPVFTRGIMIGYVRRYFWMRTWTAVLRDGAIIKEFATRELALARVKAQILPPGFAGATPEPRGATARMAGTPARANAGAD